VASRLATLEMSGNSGNVWQRWKCLATLEMSFKEPSGNTIICVTRAMQWLYAITLRNHSAARLFA
jgi:hypothetical protein